MVRKTHLLSFTNFTNFEWSLKQREAPLSKKSINVQNSKTDMVLHLLGKGSSSFHPTLLWSRLLRDTDRPCISDHISVRSTLVLQKIFSVHAHVPRIMLKAKYEELIWHRPPLSWNLISHRPLCTRVTQGEWKIQMRKYKVGPQPLEWF